MNEHRSAPPNIERLISLSTCLIIIIIVTTSCGKEIKLLARAEEKHLGAVGVDKQENFPRSKGIEILQSFC